MHFQKVTVIIIYIITVVASFVFADKESNKRMPGSAHAFQQMVRYGRSGNKDGKINVYPRADVFYLGPRYGKRSRIATAHPDDLRANSELPCTYTGVTNLYRCNTSRRPSLKQQQRI